MVTASTIPEHCPSCLVHFEPALFDEKEPSFCPKCRFPLMLIAGKYRLESLINQGGFGRLYLARHIGLEFFNERVIKVLKTELFSEPTILRRFRREVQLTANLSEQNNHIVRIYDDFGEEPQLGHYYVMEYLRGKTLCDTMEAGKPLEYALAFHIFYQLCRAMGAAHRASIIHRDLKPDNLFLIQRDTDPYFVKVIDFGLARPEKSTENTSVSKFKVMGTPAYMSPEQCSGEDIDTRSDVYAMGIIFYQMLSGRHPFPIDLTDAMGLFFAHLSKTPSTIRTYCPDFPKEFDAALLKALAKKPDDRHATVEEFWEAVAPFAPAGSNYPSLSVRGQGQFASAGFQGFGSGAKVETSSIDPSVFEETLAGVEAVSMDMLDFGEDETLVPGVSLPEFLASQADSGAHSPAVAEALSEKSVAFAPTMGLPSFSEEETKKKSSSDALSSVKSVDSNSSKETKEAKEETAEAKEETAEAKEESKESKEEAEAKIVPETASGEADTVDLDDLSGEQEAEDNSASVEESFCTPLEEADTGDLEEESATEEEKEDDPFGFDEVQTAIGAPPVFFFDKQVEEQVDSSAEEQLDEEMSTYKDKKLPDLSPLLGIESMSAISKKEGGYSGELQAVQLEQLDELQKTFPIDVEHVDFSTLSETSLSFHEQEAMLRLLNGEQEPTKVDTTYGREKKKSFHKGWLLLLFLVGSCFFAAMLWYWKF